MGQCDSHTCARFLKGGQDEIKSASKKRTAKFAAKKFAEPAESNDSDEDGPESEIEQIPAHLIHESDFNRRVKTTAKLAAKLPHKEEGDRIILYFIKQIRREYKIEDIDIISDNVSVPRNLKQAIFDTFVGWEPTDAKPWVYMIAEWGTEFVREKFGTIRTYLFDLQRQFTKARQGDATTLTKEQIQKGFDAVGFRQTTEHMKRVMNTSNLAKAQEAIKVHGFQLDDHERRLNTFDIMGVRLTNDVKKLTTEKKETAADHRRLIQFMNTTGIQDRHEIETLKEQMEQVLETQTAISNRVDTNYRDLQVGLGRQGDQLNTTTNNLSIAEGELAYFMVEMTRKLKETNTRQDVLTKALQKACQIIQYQSALIASIEDNFDLIRCGDNVYSRTVNRQLKKRQMSLVGENSLASSAQQYHEPQFDVLERFIEARHAAVLRLRAQGYIVIGFEVFTLESRLVGIINTDNLFEQISNDTPYTRLLTTDRAQQERWRAEHAAGHNRAGTGINQPAGFVNNRVPALSIYDINGVHLVTTTQEYMCPICMIDLPVGTSAADWNVCNHRFCQQCIVQHAEAHLRRNRAQADLSSAQRILRCPVCRRDHQGNAQPAAVQRPQVVNQRGLVGALRPVANLPPSPEHEDSSIESADDQ